MISTSSPLQISSPLPSAPVRGINRREGLLTLLGSAMALAGCGGGGGGAGAAGAPAGAPAAGAASGALSVGQITGFGSIIVNNNGVRIDDSTAKISDDDGNDMRGRLKLGMLVAVVSAANAAGVTTAQSITTGGELQGRVEGAPDVTLKTFVVLGQTVKVVAATVFDNSLASGFASLAADTVVEVHGSLNAKDNVLTASFIEKKTSPAFFKIQGLVSGLNTSTKKFRIGKTLINYASATEVRVTLADNALVRVRLQAVLPPTALPAEWVATRVRGAENLGEDRGEFEIEGSITAFTSSKIFSVNGVPVDASAAVFEGGAATTLAMGSRVEVNGKLSAGTLIATRVKIEDEHEMEAREFELHGTVANLTATTFELRGLTVEYSADTEFRKGTVVNLVNSARVEVKGVATGSSATATRIKATRISFE
jgi:Domain of unknown function (DUF5666)